MIVTEVQIDNRCKADEKDDKMILKTKTAINEFISPLCLYECEHKFALKLCKCVPRKSCLRNNWTFTAFDTVKKKKIRKR